MKITDYIISTDGWKKDIIFLVPSLSVYPVFCNVLGDKMLKTGMKIERISHSSIKLIDIESSIRILKSDRRDFWLGLPMPDVIFIHENVNLLEKSRFLYDIVGHGSFHKVMIKTFKF